MRSASSTSRGPAPAQDDDDPRPPADLTARARIRDTAIRRYAVDGFTVGLRAIAADAGVSAALVLHHFGSKDGLRVACDDYVLETIRTHKEVVLGAAGADQVLMRLAAMEEYAPLVAYALRSLQAGGDLARSFIDHFVADAEQYIAAGVAAGTIKPSRDEKARARYLTLQGFGLLLLDLTLQPPTDPADLPSYLEGYVRRIGMPSVELFTEGLFTDRRMLDAYLMYVTDPPSDTASSADSPS